MRDAGLKGFWSGYFAARAAPLGPVGAGPVFATFYNFARPMVEQAVPACWDAVDPSELVSLRAAAAAVALGELCSPGALREATGVLPVLRRATSGVSGDGRMLAGANAGVGQRMTRHGTAPEGAELWQSCTTLREHRGDGHVAALVTAGLGGLAAHILAAAVSGVPLELLRDNRGWSPEQWEGGVSDLAVRGLLDAAGGATAAGRDRHRAVEERTDALADAPYAVLKTIEVTELLTALRGCAEEIQASGVIPFPNPMGLPPLHRA